MMEEDFLKIFPEFVGQEPKKGMDLPCSCKHSLKEHTMETDEYGTWAADCSDEFCSCTLFISAQPLVGRGLKLINI